MKTPSVLGTKHTLLASLALLALAPAPGCASPAPSGADEEPEAELAPERESPVSRGLVDGPLFTSAPMSQQGIACSTNALVVASNGVRRLFLAFREAHSPLEQAALLSSAAGIYSRLGYAYSDDEGSSWTRQQVSVTSIGSVGFDTLAGEPSIAAYPTLPLSRTEAPAQDSMVYLVGVAGGVFDGDSFASLVISRSPNGGTNFGALYPFPPVGLLGGVPTSPSVTVDEGGLVHVAWILDAGTERGRVAYTRGGWGSRGGSGPSPEFRFVNSVPMGLTDAERPQLRRVILRAGDGPRYMVVERLEPLPAERVTAAHDARLRLTLLRERPLSEGYGWDVMDTLNNGREVLVRSGIHDGGPTPGGVDFQRVRVPRVADPTTLPRGAAPDEGPSHVVWVGHDAGDASGTDHLYYQAFVSRFVGVQGYVEVMENRVRLDEAPAGNRVAQPVVNADGNELSVSWREYDPSARTERRVVRQSRDYGNTWGAVMELASPAGA